MDNSYVIFLSCYPVTLWLPGMGNSKTVDTLFRLNNDVRENNCMWILLQHVAPNAAHLEKLIIALYESYD